VKEIQQEIEIMKKNDHPNLVKMVDLCISPSNYYIFMEYCSEGDLKSFLEKFR
jgi:serine/threonine protein kinase